MKYYFPFIYLVGENELSLGYLVRFRRKGGRVSPLPQVLGRKYTSLVLYFIVSSHH